MKKRIVLFAALSGLIYLTLTSESGGPASYGNNCTGAKASITSCSGGGTCHNSTATTTTVTIIVDSGNTPVTRYVPGMTYKVIIGGVNTSLNPKYGFEFTAVSGTGATQVKQGTYSSLPTFTIVDTVSGLDVVEHTRSLTAATPGAYTDTFNWTAPTTGAGNITMYLTLNAVNGNSLADAGDASGNTSKVLTQEAPAGVAEVANNLAFRAFPNPVSSTLNLAFSNAQAGNYNVHVFDLAGKMIASQVITLSNGTAALNTAAWTTGVYNVVIEKDGAMHTSTIVKQ